MGRAGSDGRLEPDVSEASTSPARPPPSLEGERCLFGGLVVVTVAYPQFADADIGAPDFQFTMVLLLWGCVNFAGQTQAFRRGGRVL